MSVKRIAQYLIPLLLVAMCVSVYGMTAICLRNLILLGSLVYLSVKDWQSYIIPDRALVVAVLAWLGTIPFAYTDYGNVAGILGFVTSAVLFGGGMLLFTLLMDKLLQKETMGGGDIKLFAVLALYLGMPDALFMLFLSCVFGLCFALLFRQNAKQQMPFGPSIALAGWVMLLYGDLIVMWYVNLFL